MRSILLVGALSLAAAFGPPRATTRPLVRSEFSPIDFSTTERDTTRLNYDGTGELQCVVVADALSSVGLGEGEGTKVDFVSIDIEGAEPSVLRCFPFRRFQVGAVLMRTHKVKDMP